MTKEETHMEFHKIAAFTQEGGKVIGNPAAAIVVDQFPSDEQMGYAAKTLAEPMTSFVRPTEKPDVYEIRHFSPDGDECHICGHATLAATKLLVMQNPEMEKGTHITFLMNPKFGVSDNSNIEVEIKGNNIALTMPAIMDLQPMTDPDFYAVLCAGLRVSEDDLIKPVYFAPRIRDLVVAFKDPNVLLSLDPDFPLLKEMAIEGKFVHEGLMGTVKSNIEGFDVINRVFLPGIDVNEDVACGSGNCSVIPFWATKSEAFETGRENFKVVYPYPPGEKGYFGGVQALSINRQDSTITLAGQAEHRQILKVTFPGISFGKKHTIKPT